MGRMGLRPLFRPEKTSVGFFNFTFFSKIKTKTFMHCLVFIVFTEATYIISSVNNDKNKYSPISYNLRTRKTLEFFI